MGQSPIIVRLARTHMASTETEHHTGEKNMVQNILIGALLFITMYFETKAEIEYKRLFKRAVMWRGTN